MSTAALETPPASAPIASAPAEQRVILHGVSWATYQTLSRELGERKNCRLAYHRGTLGILSPQRFHENRIWRLNQMVFILVEEHGIVLDGNGGLTCDREDLQCGLEPDSCFYIQNEARIRQQDRIDLGRDPVPDLMIEVDFSHRSLDKFPIYQALAVPEVWRFAKGTLCFHTLSGGTYREAERSPALANVSSRDLQKFMDMAGQRAGMEILAEFRRWVRDDRAARGNQVQ